MTAIPENSLRVALIDFDWQDADTLLRFARRPELSIRLVIGTGGENPGVRLANLGDLPCSSDLGDLTREVFDLAVLSERSPRREQVSALLNVLGIAVRSPEECAREGDDWTRIRADESPRAEADAIALESELSGTDPLTLISTARAPERPEPSGPRPNAAPSHVPSPAESTPSERAEIERAIQDRMALTGALHAELRLEGEDALEVALRVGASDAITDRLIELALGTDSEQVIRVMRGSAEGRCSGAWPIRTERGLALLCASGMDPDGPWETWRELAEQLRERWTRPDPAPDATPPIEDPESWQTPDRFRQNLERALERSRDQGARYSLHRFRFAASGPELEELVELLPRHLRSDDLLCRPEPQTLLLLTVAAPDTFFRLNQRVLELWEGCWRMSGTTAPDPRVDIESVELASADSGLAFLDRAARWLHAA